MIGRLAAAAGALAVHAAVNARLLRVPTATRTDARVSVLLPVRDEAPRVAACVGALLGQTGVDLEVVVLDDGSSDGTADVVREVAAALAGRVAGPVVVDPVMVATSGDRLVDDDAVAAVRGVLLPVADLVTPNVPEAAALLGVAPARSVDELPGQAEALLELGPGAVLLKGGHLGGDDSVDVLATADGVVQTVRPRIDTPATHGTGCTLSSAITALVARGVGGPARWEPAVEQARDYLQRALEGGRSLGIGSGAGPVHHFAGVRPA